MQVYTDGGEVASGMAQQQTRRSGAGSAFLWGGVFGAIAVALAVLGQLALVAQMARAIRTAARPLAGVTLVGIMLSLAVITCYFVAGLLAARRAGRIEPGIFAGLIAGSIAGLGTLVLALIGVALARRGLHMRMGAIDGIHSPRLGVATLASALARMVTSAIVGTGVGALGALVGRPRGNAAATAWRYPYQANPMAPGMEAGTGHGGMGHAAVPDYTGQTPPPAGYPTGDDTPTRQSDSIPPTP